MSALVVVMGVTGCGKSTVGKLLSEKLGVDFAEGDDLHPQANIDKMTAGHPLTDEDRWPWLAKVADWLADHAASGGVIPCSSLKLAYRDRLRQGAPNVWFLHVDVDRDTIVKRVSERKGHFMPATLVDSQFATLEPLGADEAGAPIDGTQTPEEIVDEALRLLNG